MTTKNSNNKDSATNKSTKKSKADLVEQYLKILTDDVTGADGAAGSDSAAERVLASLNSLADSDTGNPICIDSKKEISDLMKKRAQAQQQAQQQNTNGIVPPIKCSKKIKVIFIDRTTFFDKNLKIFFQLFNRLGNSLLAVIDSIKNRLETEFQEQYQRYYG